MNYFSLKAIHRALRMNNPPLTQNSVVKPSRAIRLEPPRAPRKKTKNKQDGREEKTWNVN